MAERTHDGRESQMPRSTNAGDDSDEPDRLSGWCCAISKVKGLYRQLHHTQRFTAIKRHIADELGKSLGHVDNIFKGSIQPGDPVRVLDACAAYLDRLAVECRTSNWPQGGCRDQIFAAWNGGTETDFAPVSYVALVGGSKSSRSPYFDLWTPGLSESELADHVPDQVLAAQLGTLANLGARSIGQGSFAEQLQVGKDTEQLGRRTGTEIAVVEGLYLQAESSRLLADLEPDRSRKIALQKGAIQLYESALTLQPLHPRAIRGRGRTLEVLGQLDEALVEFDRALVMVAGMGGLGTNAARSSSHETIRALRHKLNCLAAIHADMPRWPANATARTRELDDLLRQSTLQHRLKLTEFSSHEEWFSIEWFMAEVLHARALVEIDRELEATDRLRRAMAYRMRMLRPGRSLSEVERGNLQWWASSAKRCTRVLTRAEQADVEMLGALLTEDTSTDSVQVLLGNFAAAR